MDIHENKKADTAGKPEEGNAEAGTRDPKNKAGQLDKHPRKGRNRVPSTQDEVDDATENPECPRHSGTIGEDRCALAIITTSRCRGHSCNF
jgi:hypothetical protein